MKKCESMTASNVDSTLIFNRNRFANWIGYKQSESEMVEMMASVKGVVFFASRNQLEREMADSFGKNFTLVLRIPPLDEKTGKMLEAMPCGIIWTVVRN
jgi:hypothetical protein